jgi:nucleotide-binding universal stress UspA family protein
VSAPVDRPAPFSRVETILAATDGSPSSADAIALAVEMAAKHGAALTFVHVVPTLDLAPAPPLDGIGIAIPHEPTAYDHELLADAAAIAAARGVVASTALLAGATTEEIVAYAAAIEVDLVIVGSRGHRPATSALLGSVSLGVLRESTRPVLIVRGDNPLARPAAAPP